jgi:hypothetical protein
MGTSGYLVAKRYIGSYFVEDLGGDIKLPLLIHGLQKTTTKERTSVYTAVRHVPSIDTPAALGWDFVFSGEVSGGWYYSGSADS